MSTAWGEKGLSMFAVKFDVEKLGRRREGEA